MAQINKGTGAGGKNTNVNGKKFEQLTDNEENLINNGYIKKEINKSKFGYYLYKKINDIEYIYVLQGGLKTYIKKFYDIELFRNPDEAYLIVTDEKITIKILEKKAQNVEGSVETKLWSAPSFKREYELVLGDKFIVEYAFCVSVYLENKFKSEKKKYKILKQILTENNINIFYGENEDYYDKLNEWIVQI
jgi:hypothetical protein